MGIPASTPLQCSSMIVLLILINQLYVVSTNGFHLYARKHHHHTSPSKKYDISSIPEVQDYMAWIERVKARYERNIASAHIKNEAEAFHVPENFAEIPQDKVFSTMKARVERIITVNKGPGLGNFQTVQDAIDSIPQYNVQRTVIQIAAGIYREKVKIPKTKPFITVEGAGMNATVITWDDTAATSNSTFKSATFSVMASAFVARNLAFQNTAPPPPPGAEKAQAVAFQISGDQSAFFSCAFLGAQDTLYDHKGRHYFKDCWIQGSIDFIFGDGLSLYEGCELYTLKTPSGSLTAQRRKTSSEQTGFSFVNCTISGDGVVYLGRAWGAYSRVVYLYTNIDAIIIPGGWNDWGVPSREKTSFYAEYKCWGRGVDVHNRVAWAHELTDVEAVPFMSLSFIDGPSWLSSIS